jgi:orotidine-5'-phosphate decarboxylase
MRAADRLIIALDAATAGEALRLARRLRGLVRTVKVGGILFTAAGPSVVRRLTRLGFRVMLDLKFHDIPHTVEFSCRAAGAAGADLLTVHAGGGREMLRAAMRGARAAKRPRPVVLAVTVLTSDGGAGARARVLALARAAAAAGCDGVVASAQEAALLRRRLGRRLRLACPGIRPSGAARGDQRRVATPAQALRAGADWLVVGRPITAAADPRAAARAILREMETVSPC